ncbi:MAG: DUF4386 family protein [Promethearchaeota archaeon]|jgi:hypothetical protein
MTIEMWVTGFLFLFILVLNIPIAVFGNRIEFRDFDLEAWLQKINKNPKRYQIGIVLGLLEHVCVVALAIMLFIVFGPYNIILGIIWMIPRIGEGLIQIYNEKYSREFLNIAREYSNTSDTEKSRLSDLGHINMEAKNSRFSVAMILWSIGTFAYSILFIIYTALPPIIGPIIGSLGIVGSILIGLDNGMKLIKPSFKVFETLSPIGGLLSILFEILLGGLLLFISLF